MSSLASKAKVCLSSCKAEADANSSQPHASQGLTTSRRSSSPRTHLGRGRDLETRVESLSNQQPSSQLELLPWPKVPAAVNLDELEQQADMALRRSQELLDEMLGSGLFDDVSPEAKCEDRFDDQEDCEIVSQLDDSESAAEGLEMVQVPVAVLKAMASMWEELKSQGDEEKPEMMGRSLSSASTRCPSPVGSSGSSISVSALSSPVLNQAAAPRVDRAELLDELRQHVQELRRERLAGSAPICVPCPMQVCNPTGVVFMPANLMRIQGAVYRS